MSEKQIETLLKLNFSGDQVAHLMNGAIWHENSGGSPISSYWEDPEKFTMRDELFLIVNLLFSLAMIILKNKGNEDFLAYQVVYLYFLKPNAQSVLSVDTLVSNGCYGDAFAVCRSLHARVNLMLLMSLEPKLFDDWLGNPKEDCYLEGHVRTELEKYGISTMSHIYELASEIIHNQYQGNADIGYFEKGVFGKIPAIENQIIVIAKFILAAASYSLIKYGLLCKESDGVFADLQEMDKYFDHLLSSYLVPNRFEHLWASIGEERHWKKEGKNKMSIGGLFNFKSYSEQLKKFRSSKSKGQKKKLGKEYRARLNND